MLRNHYCERVNTCHDGSKEEREHAEKLMKCQNKCGGKMKLQSIMMPLSEFDHADKEDVLHG